METIRIEKSRVIVGPARVIRWETNELDEGILKETDGHLSYLGIAVLPGGRELSFFTTEAFTKEGERAPFTNPNQIKVGSLIEIMRIHFGDNEYENFVIV